MQLSITTNLNHDYYDCTEVTGIRIKYTAHKAYDSISSSRSDNF